MERIQPIKTQTRKQVNLLGLRARMPQVVRVLAVIALIATVLGIGITLYKGREPDFRMIPGLAELSKDVTAVVNGYERREMDGDVVKYYIKADKATTFADNHQELENAYLEAYDETGVKFDKLTANKVIYIPADNKNFNAHFFGNVNVETRDSLKVKSEQISYERLTETIQTEQLIEFSRENISGKSTGAIGKMKDKRLELLKEVEINSAPDPTPEPGSDTAKIQTAKLVAGRAIFDQGTGQIELEQNVFVSVVPTGGGDGLSQPTDIRAEKAMAFFENKALKKVDLTQNVEIFSKPTASNPKSIKARGNTAVANFDKELTRFEINENVDIETTGANSKPTRIRAQNAVYDKPADKFDLKNNVEIVTIEDEKPTVIHSHQAIYEQSNSKILLNGAAEITQGGDLIKGDLMEAQLFPNKKLQTALARGNAYLKQTAPDRTTEVSSNELNAFFNETQQIQKANANGSAQASIVPAQAQDYSKVSVFAPQAIAITFRPNGQQSVLSQMQTDGRTAILMSAAPGNPNSSNRKLTADSVKTVWSENGKDMLKAEAVGSGELYVEPVRAAPENYKTTITAPRFDCDFYEGNNAKICTAQVKAKAVLVPTVQAENRGTRTLTGDRLVTNFSQTTHDIERFEAIDNAKFSELDRNGIADQMTFTKNDETVRLRGGEPTVWDSRSRARASEIVWDTKSQKSFLNGKVSTTYYSQKNTGGATPFGKSDAPVFVTANEAQFDHAAQVGVYTGNARAWQENNYVRAERLILQEKAKRMDGEGKVQSMIYNAPHKEGGKDATQPAFASSDKMAYTEENKQLRYEGNVDIRQGTDRIVGGLADIFMNENNEAKQTVIQNNVIITQPKRRVAGTWAQYTSADETVILRGNPATVNDAENGTSQGSQLTFSMRDNRLVTQGATKPNATGRTRSVYKVKP